MCHFTTSSSVFCPQVERQRALQQRMAQEQQGLLGASMAAGGGVVPHPGANAGLAGAPPRGVDGLSQLPFFSSELPQDFLQSSPSSRPPPPQHQGQVVLHQGFTRPPHPGAHTAHRPPTGIAQPHLLARPILQGPTGALAQGQLRPAGPGAVGLNMAHLGGQGQQFGNNSSSPSSLQTSVLCLYPDAVPDNKPKEKRKRDDDNVMVGGARTPLSSHSDDMTAPPTPALSDASCSTPTRGGGDLSDTTFTGLASSFELERQVSVGAAAKHRQAVMGLESQRGPLEVKVCSCVPIDLSLMMSCVQITDGSVSPSSLQEEREDVRACVVKMEVGEGQEFSFPLRGGGKEGDSGKELLKHLLKDKSSPASTPSPTGQAPPPALRQLSSDSMRSEEEERPASQGYVRYFLKLNYLKGC